VDKSTPYKAFFDYLKFEKNSSENTLQAYTRDLNSFYDYLVSHNIDVLQATCDDIISFKSYLKDDGRAVTSVSRTLSCVRAFYSYLYKCGMVESNPAKSVHNDRSPEKEFDILTSEEIDKLIAQPSGKDEKAIRDKALLEFLYATGMKVSEIVSLSVSDYNETMSYVRCRRSGTGKSERFIPLYPKAKKLLDKYINESRRYLVCSSDESSLFVNLNGERMTRQGLCKIIKGYAVEAGIEKDITPKSLRHSFAAHLLENGADVSQLQGILGHADISTTNFYVDYLKKKTIGSLIALHPHS